MIGNITFGNGILDEVSHTLAIQLFHDFALMSAHGMDADKEDLANFLGPLTLCQESQNFPFPHGQEIVFPLG